MGYHCFVLLFQFFNFFFTHIHTHTLSLYIYILVQIQVHKKIYIPTYLSNEKFTFVGYLFICLFFFNITFHFYFYKFLRNINQKKVK